MRIQRTQNSTAPGLLSAVTILVTLGAAWLFGSAALAGTWYVKPSAEVPIRSGQGTDYKILSVAPDGLKVELLQEDDPWAKVRTEGGTEGWMLKRYLSTEQPLSTVVDSLTAQKEKLEKRCEEISLKFNELSEVHARTEQELNTCIAQRDEIGQNYQTLKNDTADVIKIKQSLTTKVQEVQSISQRLTAVEQENKDLKRNTSLKWFLIGGFVLFVGWFIGMITGRAGKRRSSLY